MTKLKNNGELMLCTYILEQTAYDYDYLRNRILNANKL